METEIKDTLVRLLAAIGNSDGAAVTEETTRLDGLLERGREALPGQLAHFLERRSYAKALAFLSGNEQGPKDGR